MVSTKNCVQQTTIQCGDVLQTNSFLKHRIPCKA